MTDKIRSFQISDRAKLGLAGILAVFVAAFLGALLALAIDGNGHDDHGPHAFGMVAGGPPGAQSGVVPGGAPIDPSQGGGFPGARGGYSQGGAPVPPTGGSRGFPGGSRGFPGGRSTPPSLPAIPNPQGQGSGQSGNQSQGNSN